LCDEQTQIEIVQSSPATGSESPIHELISLCLSAQMNALLKKLTNDNTCITSVFAFENTHAHTPFTK